MPDDGGVSLLHELEADILAGLRDRGDITSLVFLGSRLRAVDADLHMLSNELLPQELPGLISEGHFQKARPRAVRARC